LTRGTGFRAGQQPGKATPRVTFAPMPIYVCNRWGEEGTGQRRDNMRISAEPDSYSGARHELFECRAATCQSLEQPCSHAHRVTRLRPDLGGRDWKLYPDHWSWPARVHSPIPNPRIRTIQYKTTNKTGRCGNSPHPLAMFLTSLRLLSKSQAADELPVSHTIYTTQVGQLSFALAHQLEQSISWVFVMFVDVKMLNEMVNPRGQKGHLHFRRSRVTRVCLVFLDDSLFYLFVQSNLLLPKVHTHSNARNSCYRWSIIS